MAKSWKTMYLLGKWKKQYPCCEECYDHSSLRRFLICFKTQCAFVCVRYRMFDIRSSYHSFHLSKAHEHADLGAHKKRKYFLAGLLHACACKA